MIHSHQVVLKWIEGSVIGYLYGRVSSVTLAERVKIARTQYEVETGELLRLVESIKKKHQSYFGGRYRRAGVYALVSYSVSPPGAFGFCSSCRLLDC